MVRGFLSPPFINNDPWLDGAREADRWRDGWSSFPARAGAFAQQSAFESEWASIEPLASDLPFTLIPASLDGDGPTFPSKTTVRLMTEEEEDPIVVTGTRPSSEDTYYWYVSDGLTSPERVETTWAISADDGLLGLVCHCAGMTEAQRADQEVDAKVADIRREILAMPNQNMEYGSLIWRDSSGTLHFTPLSESSDYHARFDATGLPKKADGTTDFSVVVAMVHSHPAFLPDGLGGLEPYFSSSTPDRLLYPSQLHTRDGVVQGDWLTFDRYAALIEADGGNAAAFKQYVIGFDGKGMVINEYDAADHETGTSADGEKVDPNIEDCTC